MKGIWVPVSAMNAQVKKVDILANNIANAPTTAFKRDDVTFKEHLEAHENGYGDIDLPSKEWSPSDFYHSYGADQAFVKAQKSYTDFSQGQLLPTHMNSDLALSGPGMFHISDGNESFYTRNGQFVVNHNQQLATSSGYIFVNQHLLPELKPISVNPTIPVQINSQGQVFQDGAEVGKLNIVEFENLENLLKSHQQKFTLDKKFQNEIKPSLQTQILQGFSEQSNVNVIIEMSELMKANRHFETLQKALKTYDNMAQKSINELPKL
jgi:flagellar basal-body rod protein FlgF